MAISWRQLASVSVSISAPVLGAQSRRCVLQNSAAPIGTLVPPVVGANAGLERSTLELAIAGPAKMASATSAPVMVLIAPNIEAPLDGSHDAAAELPQLEN